jgi:uncharacterized protein YggL (DUF469 family)
MTTASDSLTNLQRLLVDHFNLDEFRTFCFDLNVDYDTLRGEEKYAKARELITAMLRQNRLAELGTALQALRPNADWPDLGTLSPEERLAWTTATEMQSAADYLVALRDYCANLPYLTLHDIRPPKTLDEVYVPLKARPLPRKDEKQERDEEHDMRELERSEPLSIADVIRQHDPPHILILGEPGAGKSTLMRQLAEHAWDAPDRIGLDAPHLPILVPLRRLASAGGALEERLNCALTAELTLTQALPQGFFTNWPKQTGANWLVLLDALDEVPAELRPQLMQWLKGLLARVGQNRVVLTSRPSGYKQGELDDKLFGHYDLLSFAPDQTSEFARNWFGDKAEQFLKELERVRAGALSGTPLLLTIAAKVYLEKGALPERRSRLYGQFVDIWLSEAEQHGLRAELGEPVCDVAKFALAHLALAMTEQPAQTEASLSKVAADYLRDAVPLTPERAEMAGERFLKVMSRRSGVFALRGDTYDFVHPTFREYLAACAAVRESRHESVYDLEHVWQQVVSRWADENWREVALFALSILSDDGKDVTVPIERIWQKTEARLYFAGDALIEEAKVGPGLSDRIMDDLVLAAREMGHLWYDFTPLSLLGELRGYPRATGGLLGTGRILSDDGKDVTALVERIWQEREEAKARSYFAGAALAEGAKVGPGLSDRIIDDLVLAARMMSPIGLLRDFNSLSLLGELRGYPRAASGLLALARDARVDESVRVDAAEVLGKLGRTDEAAQAWLALARDVQVDEWVRERVAAALGELGWADEATQAWLALARDAQVDEDMRERAAAALGELGRADDLLALARDAQVEARVRKRAAEALGKLGCADEAALILLALARDAQVHWQVRERAAETLGRFAGARVLPELERIAQRDRDEVVRWAAQQAIEQIRKRTEHNSDGT